MSVWGLWWNVYIMGIYEDVYVWIYIFIYPWTARGLPSGAPPQTQNPQTFSMQNQAKIRPEFLSYFEWGICKPRGDRQVQWMTTTIECITSTLLSFSRPRYVWFVIHSIGFPKPAKHSQSLRCLAWDKLRLLKKAMFLKRIGPPGLSAEVWSQNKTLQFRSLIEHSNCWEIKN